MYILFSVGPCALEYTKLKTSDHFWTDPSANELVQRHRIHGAHRSQDTSTGRRPALGVSGLAVRSQIPAHSGVPKGTVFQEKDGWILLITIWEITLLQ